MAQAMLLQNGRENLNECHEVFASEVVRALNEIYLIPVVLEPISDRVKYLTDGIYWGIITVSYLFREKHGKLFNFLRKGLKNENYFHECCTFIPTERDDKFFFNFLKRVSVIYEMAVFCYRNNDNYIEIARNCIAQFQDKEYFKSAGSWQRLDRIGSFLNFWSKRLRPLVINEIRMAFPVLPTTTDKVVETRLEDEGKFEGNDKDSKEGLISDITCPVEEKREFYSALVLLLADEISDISELGSIENEIKSIMRFLIRFLPGRILKYYKASPNPQTSRKSCKTTRKSHKTSRKSRKKSKSCKTLSTKLETANSKSETANSKSETANSKSETAASLFYEQLAEEMSSSLTEKICLKSKYEELGKVLEKTKACFQESLHSSKSKLISLSDSSKTKENKTGYSTILEENLYLSESVSDKNFERLSTDKDCNEHKIPSGGDHQISDKATSTSCSDEAVPAKYKTNSLKDDEYIKFLEYDLLVKAGQFEYAFYNSQSDSDGTEPYTVMESLADEGDSGVAQNNIPSSRNKDTLTMNIKSENKSEVKNNNRPLAIPTGSSTAASFAAKEDSDSSTETNNEGQFSPTKSDASESAEKLTISNAGNSKLQQRTTKRPKKKGKSKKKK